jgi:hypothetical protein
MAIAARAGFERYITELLNLFEVIVALLAAINVGRHSYSLDRSNAPIILRPLVVRKGKAVSSAGMSGSEVTIIRRLYWGEQDD